MTTLHKICTGVIKTKTGPEIQHYFMGIFKHYECGNIPVIKTKGIFYFRPKDLIKCLRINKWIYNKAVAQDDLRPMPLRWRQREVSNEPMVPHTIVLEKLVPTAEERVAHAFENWLKDTVLPSQCEESNEACLLKPEQNEIDKTKTEQLEALKSYFANKEKAQEQ